MGFNTNLRFEEVLVTTNTTIATNTDLDYKEYVNTSNNAITLTIPAPTIINGVAGAVITIEKQNAIRFTENETGNGYNVTIPAGGAKLQYDVPADKEFLKPNKRYQIVENGFPLVGELTRNDFNDGEAFYFINSSPTQNYSIIVRVSLGNITNIFDAKLTSLGTSNSPAPGEYTLVVKPGEEIVINWRLSRNGFIVHHLNKADEGQYTTTRNYTLGWNTITHNLGLVDVKGFVDNHLLPSTSTEDEELEISKYRNYTANSFEVFATTAYTGVHTTVLSSNSSNSVVNSGSTGSVQSVQGGNKIEIDNTDPTSPIVNFKDGYEIHVTGAILGDKRYFNGSNTDIGATIDNADWKIGEYTYYQKTVSDLTITFEAGLTLFNQNQDAQTLPYVMRGGEEYLIKKISATQFFIEKITSDELTTTTLASGNTQLSSGGTAIAEVPFDYDSGWKTIPVYTSALGFGMPNFNLRPQIRVKNRQVYLQNNFFIPLDDGTGSLVTSASTVTTTKSSLTHLGADTMSISSTKTLFTSRPIVPTALQSDGLAIIAMSEWSNRQYIAGANMLFSGFAGVIYTLNGRLYFENLDKTESISTGGPIQESHPFRQIISHLDAGDRVERFNDFRTAFNSSGTVSKNLKNPGSTIPPIPFEVNGNKETLQGGQQFRIASWTWPLSATVTLAQIQAVIAQLP